MNALVTTKFKQTKMPALKHTHQYVKWQRAAGNNRIPILRQGEQAYKCADPNCTHFAPKSMVLGKMTKCNSCPNEFVMDTYAIQRTEPQCLYCRQTKEGETSRAAKAIVEDVLSNLFTTEEPTQ